MDCTYEPLNITAPEELWRTLGFAINTDGKLSLSSTTEQRNILTALASAFAQTNGLITAQTVAKAIQELQRIREEAARAEASRRETAAVSALAEAISGAAASISVQQLLDGLNEHTRYAVIAQMKGKR